MDNLPTEVSRYTETPFPSYRYIPFQDIPHPHNHLEGHSYGQENVYLPDFSDVDWRTCQPYLYGVDLFNHGYWWEAHEIWENVWFAAGRTTREGIFIQGLIQLAAAQLKRFMHEIEGATILTHAGCEKLTVGQDNYLGIDVPSLITDAGTALAADNGNFPVIILKTVEQ